MSDLTTLSNESVKGLGAGAYLVNVLPSAVLVLSLVALVDARVLPWSHPLVHQRHEIAAGPSSVVQTVQDGGVAGGGALLLGVVVIAVLLRPFQIRTVQLLEGYWRRGGLLKALAIERHARRRSASLARAVTLEPAPPNGVQFEDVAEYARVSHRVMRIKNRALREMEDYPTRVKWILPTRLGNVLRRTETTAGERYGLDTVAVYSRLYPYLSPRLDAEISAQLNGIDVMATFVLVFGIETLSCAPLLWRADGWSVVPVILGALAGLSYRGATAAASHYGKLLVTAFDLHRFDMLAAMRQPLPENGEKEYESNQRLVTLLTADRQLSRPERRLVTYEHPAGPDGSSTPAARKKELDGEPGATSTGTT
jgi:hypothetical protein